MATSDKKLVRSKSGYKIVSACDELRSPLTIPEPPWVPDNQCDECMKCRTKFNFFHRRHHCRRCGLCYCGSCCSRELTLPRMCFVDPVRHCQDCVHITQGEDDFFNKHLKVLRSGGQFHVSDAPEVALDQNANIYTCKLTEDHRHLHFSSGADSSPSLEPLELNGIQNINMIASTSDRQGNAIATGINIAFTDSCGETKNMGLKAIESPAQRRSSIMWITAMQKAMKYVYEGRGKKQLSCGTG